MADWTDAAFPVLDHYLGQWEQKTGQWPAVTEMKSKGCTETQSQELGPDVEPQEI